MEYNELTHHGTKGMRWGIRRYQNKDGSLTAAGKKRRSLGQVIHDHKVAKKRKANLAKARAARAEKKEQEKTREETRAELLKSTNAKELYKNRDLLTTAEINERLYRIDTERRLSNIAESTQKSGMSFVDKALKVGRKVNEVYEFTNTPVMKALKKQLGLEKVEKRLGLDEIYKMRDKLSDKQLADALKRASTEKSIKKILDEQRGEQREKANKDREEAAAAERLRKAQEEVNDYNSGKNNYRKKADDIPDNKVGTGGDPFDNSIPRLGVGAEKVTGKVEWYDRSRASKVREKTDTIIDGEFREMEVSGVPAVVTDRGQSFVYGLLEDRSR